MAARACATSSTPRRACPIPKNPTRGSPRPGGRGRWGAGTPPSTNLANCWGAPIGSRLPPTRFSKIAENWAGFSSAAEFTADQKARILKGLRARERWFELIDIYSEHVRATRPRGA